MDDMSRVARKPVSVFPTRFDIQGCTVTEDGWRLEISEKKNCTICRQNKGTDQLCGHSAADLHLCFHICKKQVF